MSAVKPARTYVSPLRREQAAATRRRILEAAQPLFEANGYQATSMSEIAAGAGVALKTLYVAFEGKSGLFRALWHLCLRGDEGPDPVGERVWFRAVLDEPDPVAQLRLNARNSRAVKERVGGLFEVMRTAAAGEPEIDALWRRIQDEFYENQRAIVRSLHRKRALKPRLGVTRATDIVWALNHPDTYRLLVTERGWTPGQYERWLGDLFCTQLLTVRDEEPSVPALPKPRGGRP